MSNKKFKIFVKYFRQMSVIQHDMNEMSLDDEHRKAEFSHEEDADLEEMDDNMSDNVATIHADDDDDDDDEEEDNYFEGPGTHGLLFNDDELFSTDDNLVRRMIYAPSRNAQPVHCHNAERIIVINFTKQHFEPGATKWHHLKNHYYELLSSVFNSLAFATGKKVKLTPSEKVVREKATPNKRRGNKTGGDDESHHEEEVSVVNSVATTPEIEINNFLQGNKDISVFIETLVTANKVTGFRWWIFDRTASKTNNDTLSLGLRESLLEAAKIQEQANRQMQLIVKSNGSTKSAKAKKAAATKQYALSKEFSFTNYATFDRHFTGIVARYFSKDSCLTVSENGGGGGGGGVRRRQFKDTREYTSFDPLKQHENPDHADYTKLCHPCNLSKLFAKEAAMFYYVNEESINEAQCRLESYFANATGGRITRAHESAHCRADLSATTTTTTKKTSHDAPRMMDVADYVGSAQDKEFTQFPYESITYHLHNTFVSHEFVSRMPLPHRIGSTLYTQKDVVELKQGMGLSINPVEEAEAETEQVDDNEIGDFLERLALSEQSEMETSVYGRRQASRQQQQKVSYGGGASVVRYMGLHQTEMELTTEIMLSQLHHVDSSAHSFLKMAVVPRDILDKFLANKRNELNSRLKLIITNLGHKNRTVVSETLAAAIDTQEDTRRKSLSAAAFLSTKAVSNGRDQTVNIMDQIGHTSHIDESDVNLLQLPYVSLTVPGLLNNANKSLQIKRKAFEYVRRRTTARNDEDEYGYALDPVARVAQLLHEDKEYQSKVASGKVAHYKEIIERYRPYGNSLYTIRSQLHQTDMEEVYLGRDIFLRLAELNTTAYANLDLAFFDPETGQVAAAKEEAYLTERRYLRDALAVECWHEFFENPSVSLACDGIRSDLLKQKITYAPPESCGGISAGLSPNQITTRRMVGTPLPVHDYKQELRPFAEHKTWIQSLFADQFGIAYNYKIMWILYMARLHHCRWQVDCNSPKHNIILSGTGMAGKSHMLQSIKKILPTGVGDMVIHITDQAFNVDRNMNDMLLIYEEFQNKYLGYSGGGGGGGKNTSDGGGGGGGVSAGSDKDTTNFFKARLTSQATTTMSWFENEETGMRDMKISKAHCQGSMMGASNNDFTYADSNVMSRFILLSVPKSKAQHEGNRPQDKTKFQFGTDTTQNRAIYEQHKELHRVYFLVEQMIKSNVLGENVYGVNVDGGRIMRDLILDHLQKRYGISTGDVRKRDHILEMMRSMALSCAVWIGLTSCLTRDLQYDPHDPSKFIGFNPRVITEGIFPFMVVTKDMVFDAITALSSLWYHDYQDLIIEVFATKHCRFQELRELDFLVRPKMENYYINLNASTAVTRRGGGGGGGGGGSTRLALTQSSNGMSSALGNAYGGDTPHGQFEKEIDYNYVAMRDKTDDAIFSALSLSLGDMVVAQNDICKLLTDLSKCRLENCDSYEMTASPEEHDEESGAVTRYHRRLVRGAEKKNMTRTIVEFTKCPSTGKRVVAILVHFLKQKLPALFSDDLIEDLNKNERRVIRATDLADVVMMGGGPGDFNMRMDEDDYEERVRRIGMITEKDETLIIKSFRDKMENAVLEDMGMEVEEREVLERHYANPSTGVVPWRVYITADAPKPELISDFYPELKEPLQNTDDGDAPILFVDELKMLELKAKPTGGKIIIRNYNTTSPSTSATLSIHKERSKQVTKRSRGDDDDGDKKQIVELGPGEVLKKCRIQQYSRIEAWELDADIDYIFCQEHLRNIAFNGLPSRPNDDHINYPPRTYMAIMQEKMENPEAEPLLEYPFVNNMVRIANRKRHAQGLINPESVQYPKLGRFLLSNFAENSKIRQKAMEPARIGLLQRPTKERCQATEKKRRQELMESLTFTNQY